MPDAADILGRAAIAADSSLRGLAREMGVDAIKVRRALARFAPVHETLSQVKREESVAGWQTVQFKALAAMDAFLDGESPLPIGPKSTISAEIRNLAVAAGIASEKALLFAGQPTVITQVTSDLRAELPAKLALVARLLEARQAGIGPGWGTHEALDVTPTPIIGPSGSGEGR